MRENDIRLFNYIAKIAARKDDTVIAPNRFEGVGPLESDDSIRQEDPTDYSWVTLLYPTLGVLLVGLLRKLYKLYREDPSGPGACAKKALEILIRRIKNSKPEPGMDAVELFSILKDVIDKLDDECRAEFLSLNEVKIRIGVAADGLGLTPDEVLERLKDKTPEGLIAIATMYLRLGAQNAAIRMFVLGQPGGNEQLANWVAGLGLTVAMIIALGVVLAAGSVLLDLTGFGLPAGIAVGTASAAIIALGIWLQQNQGNNNSGNSA
jgi:DNA-binding Lrp family transcriptional regulator